MELYGEKPENYQKNLRCIQDAADKLLSHMKGHRVSFRQAIIDKNGAFSQEKLIGLVEKLLSLWAAELRAGTFTDPATGESLAEPYIQARRELYGSYLYLVIRCMLRQGAYALVCGGEMKERADFAFLLEQARRLFRSWCVMADQDGCKKNELFQGFDDHFGFHLYRVLSLPKAFDNPLTFEKDKPMNHLALLTDEGYLNRLCLKEIFPDRESAPWTKNTEATGQPDGESDNNVIDLDLSDGDEYGYGDESTYGDIDYDDYNPAEDEDWYLSKEETEAMNYALQQQGQKEVELESLVMYFEHREEYLTACMRFVELFQQAKPEVLWGFYEDLEMMIGLYLLEQDIPPLADTDKTLDVYGRIVDGPCRQAKRYERGSQWKNL